ncbi:MAG: DUF2079 domain-containing protein, partial [Dehalococcoidia bacterium]|nr:DUF2079 domain-containing protein [Dehalococcoidia bacterium]
RRFALFAYPALLVKEEVGLFLAALGLYWLLGRKKWAVGTATAALGLAWVLVTTWLVIPALNPGGEYFYLNRYSSLGSSHSEILTGFLLRPGQAVAQVLTPEKIAYVFHLLAPLGFLPLLGPGVLALALPTLGYLLLRGDSPSFLIITQYAAPMVPFLFYATARAMARARKGPQAAALAAVVLVATGASYYLHSPGPLSRNFVPQRYTVSPRAAVGKEMSARIPTQAGVVAQSDLVPHLSRREMVYMFPEVPSYDGIDYILLDREGNRYPLADSDEAYQQAVAVVLADPQFHLVDDREGYLLLERTREGPTTLDFVLGGKVKFYGYSLRDTDSSSRDLTLSLYWETLAPLSEDYSLFIHLVDTQGRRLAQWDGPPLGRHLPTTRWRPGSRLRGNYVVSLPQDIPQGSYRLNIGLYNWQTLERLSVGDEASQTRGDSAVIEVPSLTR